MGVKKRVKSLGEKLIPISPEFRDTERDEDLVAPKNVLLPFNAFLLISQWVAFCILMWWYASPANNISNTTIQVDWDYGKGTYNCTPMMKDSHYGNSIQLRHLPGTGAPAQNFQPGRRYRQRHLGRSQASLEVRTLRSLAHEGCGLQRQNLQF